jgi:rod shape-determining protein MreC
VHDKQVRRRRVLLAVLVAVSLILLTAYFGESPTSPLHSVQRGIVEVLSPIQEGASKVLKPVSNIAGWFSDTLRAKSQVDKLRQKVYSLEAKLAQYQSAAFLNQQLSREVGLDRSLSLSAYARVAGQVIARDPTLWYQTVEIDKGSDDGVHQGDPVLGWGALVGMVSSVAPTVSTVSLITDHAVSVTARVADGEGDTGVLVPAVGNPNQLVLQDLPTPNQPTASDPNPGPAPGDQVLTAGFKSGPLESLYPAGIPIGTVSSVDSSQLANNGQLDVSPIADLRRMQVVQILTRPQAAGVRAQVGGG